MSASANRCMVMIMWPLLSPAFAADPAPTPPAAPAAPQPVPAAVPRSDAAKTAENARDLHALNAQPPAAWCSKK